MRSLYNLACVALIVLCAPASYALPPTVTSFIVTPSGFQVQFSEPIDVDVLNLYDSAAAPFGPPDATLSGSTTGPVAGSLVCASDGMAVEFVRTGGPLPVDTYTVVLRSATNGFKDLDGQLLDGDGNGTAGGDYTTGFTVAGATRQVMLPDFCRGPGQWVKVPAGWSETLPVVLSDGADVTSVDLTILHANPLVRVDDVVLGADVPADWSFTNKDLGTPGQTVLSLSGPTPLSASNVSLLEVVARVWPHAPYRRLVIMRIVGVQLSGGAIDVTGDAAVHAIAYIGDTTGNGDYTDDDAALVEDVVVGLASGFEAHPRTDPVIIGDVTGNGGVSGLDANWIERESQGIDMPEIPNLPWQLVTLDIATDADEVRLFWPLEDEGFILQSSLTLGPGAGWNDVESPQVPIAGFRVVTVSRVDALRFYRLLFPLVFE